MEFNISDLLDDLQEVDLNIHPNSGASVKRIKELTMKKIHPEKKHTYRGLSTLSKDLIAAAIMASLAIPVMAATGFHFTDWLDGLFTSGKDYNSDLADGSASKNWQVSGYVVELKAENASTDGLTLICEEWGNGEKEGTLTADDSFWLEQWNGSEYTALSPKSEPAAGEATTIAPKQTATWQITWADSYGTLESGSYRIGKTFTYTAPSGKHQTVDFYAKFRVFAEDMAPYVERCKASLEELRTRDSYHLTETFTGDNMSIYTGEPYAYRTYTVWKNGEDFLIERRFVQEDGTVISHGGSLFRDGKGYTLAWNGDDVLSGVSSWETVDYLNEQNRDLWNSQVVIYDAHVGEVYAEGNAVSLLEGHSYEWLEETEWNKKTYVTDENGKLISARAARIPSPEKFEQEDIQSTVEVHDTSPAEIAKIISAQNVDKPIPFSWQEDQAKYPAGSQGVKTEGFANTTAQAVTLQNVVSLARKECTLEWQNTALVYYDEMAQVWKVELGFSQDDSRQTVYLDQNGITRLVVTG